MTLDLQAPFVPFLDAFGVLDLDDLVGEGLITTITLQGAPMFDWVHPHWRGTAVDGTAVDVIGPSTQVTSPDMVIPVVVARRDLTAIDQGHALYAYTIQPTDVYQQGFEESRRTAVLVGKRHFPGAGLNVAVLKQAHRQQFDRTNVPDSGASVCIPAWQAMRAGDTLTLRWQAYDRNGVARPEYTYDIPITRADIGLPVPMQVPRSELGPIARGHALLSYRINFISGGQTVSAAQRFEIFPAETDLLPMLTIAEQSGPTLDPTLMTNGLTFCIDRYAQLSEGDTLVVYATDGGAETSEPVASVRLDQTSVDSGLLHCTTDGDWLWDYLGRDLVFSYHVARPGVALASEPLRLPVRAAMNLPAPIVQGASGAGQATGDFKAIATKDGVKVWVPSLASYPADASIEMHWEGFGAAGSYVARTSTGDIPAAYMIVPQAVAPNMGKRVRVFYRVLSTGEPTRQSAVFTVNVLPVPEVHYPTLRCTPTTNGTVRPAALTAAGTTQAIAIWPLIAAGQLVEVIATGLLKTGVMTKKYLLDNVRVTSAQASGGVSVQLAKAWWQEMQVNRDVTLTVRVSADEGESYVTFPRVYITVVA